MSGELSGIEKIAGKKKVSSLASKPQVSLEKTEKKEATSGIQELKKYEIELERANHAFALMTEIREKLEKAIQEES